MSEKERIEIEFRPLKKIVIFEAIELSLDELLKRTGLIASTGQIMPLNWSEGIVFFSAPFHPECDIVAEEAMKGNVYWSSVMYALMPKYEPSKKIGGFEIPIIDQTSSSYIRQIARWLKERKA